MTIASVFRIAGYGLLALVAFWAPTVATAGAIQTSTSTLTIIPSGADADNFTNADAESFSERLINDSTWTSSALAQVDGNLEVGVTATPRGFVNGKSQAFADLRLTQHYEAGDARIGAVRFTVQPGEILFSTELNAPFQGEFDGLLFIGLSASINDVTVSDYSFRMEVKSTNGGIDINSGSTGTALVHLSEVLSGGHQWGVRTSGFTDVLVITPAIFPGDVVTVSYDMRAEVTLHPLDGRFTYSAKIGDPLDTIGGGGVEFASSVPEPSSAWLMTIALCAIGAHVSNQRRRRRSVVGQERLR